MRTSRRSIPSETVTLLTPSRSSALAYLLRAHRNALDSGRKPTYAALQLRKLKNRGVTESTLQWLAKLGFVDHLLETTRPNQRGRTFRPAPNLSFTVASCFVLTAAGIALAESLVKQDETNRLLAL